MHSSLMLIFTAIMMVIVTALVATHRHLRSEDEKTIDDLKIRNKRVQKDLANARAAGREALLSAERFQQILINTQDMVFVYGLTKEGLPGNFLEINNKACEELKYPRERLLGMSPLDVELYEDLSGGYQTVDLVTLSPKEIREQNKKLAERPASSLMQRLIKEESIVYNTKFRTSDSNEIPLEISSQLFNSGGETLVISTAHDITKRKEASRMLDETQKRFHSFFEHSPIGVAIYDANKALIDVNRACLKMFGIPDYESFKSLNLFEGEFIPSTIREKLAHGESVRFEMSLDFDDARHNSFFISTKSETAHFDVMINNLGFDKDFKPRGHLTQVLDITRRREAELSLHQSAKQLRQAEKMEAIGSMAGGIAHDFNNILTPIIGYTEIALRKCTDEDPMNKFFQEILKASYRAKDLVNQILNFSRQRDQEGQPLHATPVVKEVLTLIRASLPPQIEVHRIIKTDRDIVFASPTQLHQVLMNLATNAGHAMSKTGGGDLEVRLTDFLVERTAKTNENDLSPGRYLRISVSDTGVGMDEKTVSKIFEPFFTTKKEGEGTGMGLSVVHNIITSFGGTITVDSEQNKGTTFNIILPSLEERDAAAMTMESDANMPSGTERILAVDDEPDIAELESHMLTSLGYKVTASTSSKQALEIFTNNPDDFDIVITDQVMPNQSGDELIKEIRKIRKDIPILICTGFSDQITEDSLSEMNVGNVIMKPIIMRNLAEILRNTLDGKTT